MPRTKVPKAGKRNRDADVTQREETLREYEKIVEEYLANADRKTRATVNQIETEFRILRDGLSPALLNANFSSILDLHVMNLTDLFQTPVASTQSNDDEESATGRTSSCSILTTFSSVLSTQSARGRTPGPLTSRRRSRSACYDNRQSSKLNNVSTMSSSALGKTPMGSHTSRNKMRTPAGSRAKALSADRSAVVNTYKSPPSAFFRWPKPGELVMSVHGTPVLAQVMPDKVANVNIPVRDGIFSLRPKKLGDLHPELVDHIDPETLDQIKTLNANLNKIVSMAERSQQ